MTQGSITMTQDELEDLIEKTVNQTLVKLGVDPEDPLEVQRDFKFVRDWRKSSEAVKRKALLAAVGIVVTGAIGAILVGIRHALHQP